MVSMGTIMVAGDAVAQTIEGKGRLDLVRSSVMVSWSVGAYCPFFVAYWGWLNTIFTRTTVAHAAIKAFMSAAVAGIPLNAAFMTYATVLEGTCSSKPQPISDLLKESQVKVRNDLFRVWSSSVGYWMPCNMFNFLFIPAHFRQLALAGQSVLWMAYLSLVQHE